MKFKSLEKYLHRVSFHVIMIKALRVTAVNEKKLQKAFKSS